MAKIKTKKCYGCKQDFRITELIDYTGLNAQIPHSYCPSCLKEKQEREQFSIKVCTIFGIKAPGPIIWTQRKRLQNKYGYTDNIIIECLDYIYNVEKKKKLSESLCLINPISVDRMLKWKRMQQYEANKLASATQMKTHEQIVSIKENVSKKENLNPDDWLED